MTKLHTQFNGYVGMSRGQSLLALQTTSRHQRQAFLPKSCDLFKNAEARLDVTAVVQNIMKP